MWQNANEFNPVLYSEAVLAFERYKRACNLIGWELGGYDDVFCHKTAANVLIVRFCSIKQVMPVLELVALIDDGIYHFQPLTEALYAHFMQQQHN